MAGDIEFVVGTKTKIELVSATHGAVRVPLAQNFDYTPAFDERRIFEFDNEEAVAVVTNFNGVQISFNHLDSASKLVDAMVNDIDPAATATVDDPANYQDLTLFLNVRSKSTDLIFQSILVKGARLNGAASTEPVREEASIARTGVATNALRIKGAAIEYNRVLRSGSTAFAQGSENSQADKTAALDVDQYEFDVDNALQNVTAKDSDINGQAILLVLKNGEEYDISNVDVDGTTLGVPDTDFGANDVFEFFTAYVDS